MLPIRRAAVRILSSPFSAGSLGQRNITPLTRSSTRPARQNVFALAGGRWFSDHAGARDEDVPISKLQPTPPEEVENAVHEDADANEARGSASATGFSKGFGQGREDAVTRFKAEEDRRFAPKATVYIGNLFFDVTEDDLLKELSTIGTVKRVRIIRDARGLSKGFGYVTFDNIDQATKAITTLNQQLFEGRRLAVQFATHEDPPQITFRSSAPKNPPSKTLFIGNMSWQMTDRDLNELFRGIRNVIDVRVAIDRRTGQPRGFAHADFIDIKSAMEARKALDEKEVYGRKLRIDYSYGSNAAPRNQARDAGEQPPPADQYQE